MALVKSAASRLRSATTVINVASATAPSSGQVLKATSSTNAQWDTPLTDFFNVVDYGATGDGSTDDTAAIQSAVDACKAAGGGVVWFPAGTYKLVTNPIRLYSGSTPNIVPYSNITLMGAGSNALTGSIITQTSTGVDCIKGLNDVANGAQALNNTIKNLSLVWGTATKTNSGNGIYLAQQAADGPSFQQWTIENVSASGFQGSGKYGFNFESIITSSVLTCNAVECANGFYLNGAVSGAFSSVNTSVTFYNCYANMNTNGANGYKILDSTYVSFVGCACDIGANNTASAYLVNESNCVSFTGCGTELNGTATLTNMWKIENGSGQIGLYNCYGYQSKSSIDVYVTGTSTGVTIVGFQDNSSVSGSTGLRVDAGSEATEMSCNFEGAATPRNIASTAVWKRPEQTRVSTETSSATPSINVGATDIHSITALATAITSMTTNLTGTPTNGQHLIVRIKDNGTNRAITWGASFAAKGVALPTTTAANKLLTVGFEYDSVAAVWGCIASAQEA